ncbi:hypothetical protein [Pyrococcus yayanosii]|uniref:Uncharacterized protein n=1 Tax=Pyrococcus yayanosii (strain CH1 / JCM 16557) TaxID=529709 RepID=F8AIU5_PYRYC|nr:hypothetical protein [Pyrococcus yayanosii]AEH24420.1 hypothetical protein PYCH_07320 [Pyrococcus yayanosii CH1]
MKKALVVLLVLLLALPPAVVYYGYSRFPAVLSPTDGPQAKDVIYVPCHGKLIRFEVESYMAHSSGNFFKDLNWTVRFAHYKEPYKSITIIVGSTDFEECANVDKETCLLRTESAGDISGCIGAIATAPFYLQLVKELGNETEARLEASKKAMGITHNTYLTFMQKVKLGLGIIGNDRNLVIILIGPKEGAKENKIYIPRDGVLVVEATGERELNCAVGALLTLLKCPG